VDEAQVTAEMQLSHNLACSRIKNSPASWTSHTVAVIDQSGSAKLMERCSDGVGDQGAEDVL
jgi:hypothetical protein